MKSFYPSNISIGKCARLVRISAITVCMLFVATAATFAKSSTQQRQLLTLNLSNTPVKEVLAAVEKQSSYRFIYSSQVETLLARRVTVKATKATIEDVMKAALSSSGLSFNIKGWQVTVFGAAGSKGQNPPPLISSECVCQSA